MSSTYRQRFYGEDRQNDIRIKPCGQLRLFQVCLNYEGTEAPLYCTIDGDRIRQLAQKKGATDIVSLYDDFSTEGYPSKQEVVENLVQMLTRSQAGDYIVFQYSGHGTSVDDEDGDEEDGKDQALCLRTREGQDQYLIDDQIAEIVSKYLNPKTIFIFFVDACFSGTILDLTKGGIWGGKKVFCLSGCQDTQCSNDTGNGGQMTNALLQILNKKSCRKRRKNNNASIQFVFNRMVDKMPDDEEEEQNEQQEQENKEFTEEEFEEGWQNQGQEEEQQGEDDGPEPGQWLNLSWCGGTDPCHVSFPL